MKACPEVRRQVGNDLARHPRALNMEDSMLRDGRGRPPIRNTLVFALVLAACSGTRPPAGGETDTGGSGGEATGGSPTGGAQGTGGKGGSTQPASPDASGTAPEPDAAVLADTAAPPAGEDGGTAPPDPGMGGDDPPDRPLNVDKASPQVYSVKFKPTDIDPTSTGKDETQTALVDTSKTMQKKLVIVLAGTGGAPGPIGVANYAASLGFHAYAIAYHDEYNASTGTGGNPEVFTNSRFNEFDGKGRTPSQVKVPRADSVEVRVTKAMTYLQMKNPQGDWAYYLKKDGTVRWSDVIFIGHSHGATSSAAFAKLVRVWRAISLSGPRDTNPVVATWLKMPGPTPIDRYFGFTGTGDSQHQDHIKAMEVAGYLGTLTAVEGMQPPYGGSHRLKYNGGHGGSANCSGAYAPVCKYMLGVP
jgi:dienelactone hydrolase